MPIKSEYLNYFLWEGFCRFIKIILNYYMKILFQTEKLLLISEYEIAKLIDRLNGTVLLEEYFYGDPMCGLISIDNSWAIIAGIHLIIWTSKETKIIEDDNLKWIHSIRYKTDLIVEILIDPWSESSAIWELNTNTFDYIKIKDFDNYKNQMYTDFVVW